MDFVFFFGRGRHVVDRAVYPCYEESESTTVGVLRRRVLILPVIVREIDVRREFFLKVICV